MIHSFHPLALEEYLAAAKWYEERRAALGAEFTLEVESAIHRILEAPRRWAVLEEDVRRCLTHTFPYGILYSIEGDTIVILAVMHCSRKPGYWKSRLK